MSFKHQKLGKTKLNISKIGLGGAAFMNHSNSKDAKEVVNAALKEGTSS